MEKSDVVSYFDVNEYFQTQTATPNSNVELLVKGLLDKAVKLDAFFESIESYLVSKETSKRSKAVKLVSDLIIALPDSYLNAQEVDHLCKFMCSKLDDHYTISTAALPGLKILFYKYAKKADNSSRTNLISDATTLSMIKGLLRDIHVQSMVQSDRFIVYSICQFVLTNPDSVQLIRDEKYESDFVYGFIQAMDGEKDPRNLLVCFECVTLMCKQINLGPFVDETYEVIACYFPIDFTPPKNDNAFSIVVTKQMLVDSLRSCLASSKHFAKQAIPLFLEKLNANAATDDILVDTLDTFSKCTNCSYDPNDYKEYIETLWASFHRMAMNATKTALEEAALNACRELTASISRSLQSTSVTSICLDTFIESTVVSKCSPFLNEVDLKLVWPNVKCLQAVASASSTANVLIMKHIIPVLIDHYNSSVSQNQKKTYLDILWQFISNSKKFDSKNEPKIVQQLVEQLFQLCFDNLNNKHLCIQALTGLYQLLSFEKLLLKIKDIPLKTIETEMVTIKSNNNLEMLAYCLWDLLNSFAMDTITNGSNESSESDELNNMNSIDNKNNANIEEKQKAIEILYIIIEKDESIAKWFFDILSGSLTQAIIVQIETERASLKFQLGLEIIETISKYSESHTEKQVFVNECVLFILDEFLKNLEQVTYVNINSDILIHIFSTMKKVFEILPDQTDENSIISVQKRSIIKKLFELTIFAEKLSPKLDSLFSNYEVIIKSSLVFQAYALRLTTSTQISFEFFKQAQLSLDLFKQIIKTFVSGANDFKPLELESSIKQKQKLPILMQTVCSLDKKVFESEIKDFFKNNKEKLLKLALETSLNDQTDEVQCVNLLACQFYAALLNKLKNGNTLEKSLTYISEHLQKTIEDREVNGQQKSRYLQLWIWITKALVLREHESFLMFTNKIVEWLDNPVLSKTCSGAFNLILNDNALNCHLMNSKSGSNIRLFYRQRFFNTVLEPLRLKFESSQQKDIKISFMVSVLSMLPFLPKSIIQKQIKSVFVELFLKMLPILLYSLSNTTNDHSEEMCLSSLNSVELLVNDVVINTSENSNSTVETSQSYFLTYTSDILNKLLALCHYENNMRIRLLALNCVNSLAKNLQANQIIKYQKLVCKQLEDCLNDKKRICRQKAVEARNRWFLLTTKED